jgi:hypothetical protein
MKNQIKKKLKPAKSGKPVINKSTLKNLKKDLFSKYSVLIKLEYALAKDRKNGVIIEKTTLVAFKLASKDWKDTETKWKEALLAFAALKDKKKK